MTDRPRWTPEPGDVVQLREIPPTEVFQPGVLDTYRHPAVEAGDEGTVEEYTSHADGEETILVRFDETGLIVYPQQIKLIRRP